jgi:hypothetical protein
VLLQLADDALQTMPRDDWSRMQQLAKQLAHTFERARSANVPCADEAALAHALTRFASGMHRACSARQQGAAGAQAATPEAMAAASSATAAALLAKLDADACASPTDKPSLPFVLFMAQLSDAVLYELEFDGIGGVRFSALKRVLSLTLVEAKASNRKGAHAACTAALPAAAFASTVLFSRAQHNARGVRLLVLTLPRATAAWRACAAGDAAVQAKLRARVLYAVAVAAAIDAARRSRRASPLARLRRVEVHAHVALLQPLSGQQRVALETQYGKAKRLRRSGATKVSCSLSMRFWALADGPSRLAR